jgi:hypothetical protein
MLSTRYYIMRLITLVLILSVLACSSDNDRRKSTYGIAGMIKIVNLDHDDAISSLVSNGYNLESSDVIYQQRVTIMSLKDKATSVKMFKSQWTDSGKVYGMVHLDLKPLTLDTGIYAELLQLNFKLKERRLNKMRSYRLYSKDLYAVSIYRFTERTLPLSVELHKLP